MSVLYKAISGMKIEQERMEIISRNLAGASVPGFKSQEVLSLDFDGYLNNSSKTGQGALMEGEFVDYSKGPINKTGRDLDFAIVGEGFFQVESENGQNTFLTRSGRFRLNAAGELIGSNGFKVVGDTNLSFGPNVNLNDIEIAPNGLIKSGEGAVIGKLKIMQVTDLDNLEKVSGVLYRPKAGSEDIVRELPDDERNIQGRAIEGANISTVKEMVTMISTMRKFEMGQKMIKLKDGLKDKEFSTFGS
jgi:flagellar basal body rod protein FlgG